MAIKTFLHLPIETMGMSKAIRLKRYLISLLYHSTPLKISNLIRVESELRKRSVYLRGFPYVLKIESTNICNLRCRVCYDNRKPHYFGGSRGYGKMEPDLFFRIVDEIGKYIYRINLYGFGEPFIYDKTLDMVRYAVDHNISVAIASNFNIVNEEIMERIIQSGLEHLIVSIDGIDQTSYEKYKVGGDFNKVITNVRLFQNMKKKMRSKLPFVDWQFVIMKHNAQMRKQAKTMAQELGIGIRYTCIGIDIKDHHQQEEWLPENESLSQYDYETLTPKGAKDLQTCSWLYRTVFINWDGGVSPCCNYYTGEKKSDFGDVKYRSFREVWNNQSYTLARQFVTKQKTLNEEDKKHNICGRCEKFCIAKGQ